jgi:natural product biosynthesis luciferase-like monooxygenase protein
MIGAGAVFVGDGSLLVRCAQAWKEAGHAVKLVASANEEILAHARSSGIETTRIDPDAIRLPPTDFDYLFSVANLHLIDPEIVARAGRLALNFHDGPLPRYAGLNATSWALMAGETTHGVTWHEMTDVPDAGRIAKQVIFPIQEDETALSLNARCYEAGLASFTEIAREIARGHLALRTQGEGRTYFSRDRRPAAWGTLDFLRPAREIAAMVRALDFGSYANALARPKILLRNRLLLARGATVLPSSTGQPGTVIAATADSLRVVTGEGDIVLTGLTEIDGSAAHDLPAAGEPLPAQDRRLRDKLAAAAPRVARGERHWSRALSSLAPVELPYPRQRGAQAASPGHVAGRAAVPGAFSHTTLAGLAAWMAAISGQDTVSLLYSDSSLMQQAEGLEKWLGAWVVMTFTSRAGDAPRELASAAQAQLNAVRTAGPCPRDLPLRLGDRHPPLDRLRVGVAVGAGTHNEPPQGIELVLQVTREAGMELVSPAASFDEGTLRTMAGQLSHWLAAFESGSSLGEITLLSEREAKLLRALNATDVPVETSIGVHQAIAAQAARTPDAVALSWQGEALPYRSLEERATALAQRLAQRGVRSGDIVGLCLDRTPELVITLLAVMKAGAAYLPLDPEYPAGRLAFMIEDSGTRLVVTTPELARAVPIDVGKAFLIDAPADNNDAPAVALPAFDPESAAYVIYTSGSTGQPKGVVVTHRNVVNFFAGMDLRIPHEPPGRWLAVTSLSFDISVLELCWTLARGFTVALHSKLPLPPLTPTLSPEGKGRKKAATPEFSLFYFASDHASTPQDRYRLLMEGVKFADRNGFAAVWTPERHFHAFGGLYPNPAVTSAALAACTSQIQIRAGSCVLPLHHPIRVAEEWAFVDNISQGRVGIAFAAGWQPNDFVIAPQAFANRKSEMLTNIDVVRRLWRGERVPFPGPTGKDVEVLTLPRPVQAELPVWLTVAGNPETFRQAGELGCYVLTHLLGQTVEEVAEKLKIYRMAWYQAGHAGHPQVTLMLHTFVGDDDEVVRETVRQPMKHYLRSAVDLVRQAAWSFPTFVQRSAKDGRTPVEIMESAPLSEDDVDALLEHAFNRYYGTSALFGTRERCLAMVEKLRDAGVDEISCLIDFGIDMQTVLDHLTHLKDLMEAARHLAPAEQRVSIAEQIAAEGVTHLQCTPSMASMLVADSAGRAALSRLSALMVGGEALPLELARKLRELVPGQVLNMYGPTETTIWSTTCALREPGEFVPLGQPIANTRVSLRTAWGMECPALVPGELWIGGAGVARGYLGRPELTAQRFVTDAEGQRWYRTGDLVRRYDDGSLEFLGRIDHQVKIRGHRIELGEIEALLLRQDGVKEAVAIARADAAGEKRLLAYVTAQAGTKPQPEVLRAALARELPEIMVPALVLVLAALPITPNGKVDRRALPEPQAIAVRPAAIAPQSDIEKTIASIWEDVLGLPQVGTADNFFDLGGHSLLVVQVQRRLREACGREVSITDMFRLPTIKSLAAHLGGNAPAASAVGDGLARAKARRTMRSRGGAGAHPAT